MDVGSVSMLDGVDKGAVPVGLDEVPNIVCEHLAVASDGRDVGRAY